MSDRPLDSVINQMMGAGNSISYYSQTIQEQPIRRHLNEEDVQLEEDWQDEKDYDEDHDEEEDEQDLPNNMHPDNDFYGHLRQKIKVTKTKKLVFLSRTVLEHVKKIENTTGVEIVKEILRIYKKQKKNMDYKNVQRRVYDALNVLSALKFTKKYRGRIIWQNIFVSQSTSTHNKPKKGNFISNDMNTVDLQEAAQKQIEKNVKLEFDQRQIRQVVKNDEQEAQLRTDDSKREQNSIPEINEKAQQSPQTDLINNTSQSAMNIRLQRLQRLKRLSEKRNDLERLDKEYQQIHKSQLDEGLQKILQQVALKKLIVRNYEAQQERQEQNFSSNKNIDMIEENNCQIFDLKSNYRQQNLKEIDIYRSMIGIKIPFQGIYVKQFYRNQSNDNLKLQSQPNSPSRESQVPSHYQSFYLELADISKQSNLLSAGPDHNIEESKELDSIDKKPFFNFQIAENRQTIRVEGLLSRHKQQQNLQVQDIKQSYDDQLEQFNENYVLKRLGLTKLESLDEVKNLIKPSHRKFLYECLDLTHEKENDQINSQSIHGDQDIDQRGQVHNKSTGLKFPDEQTRSKYRDVINNKQAPNKTAHLISIQNKNSQGFNLKEFEEQFKSKSQEKTKYFNYKDFDEEEFARFRKYRKMYDQEQILKHIDNTYDKNGQKNKQKQVNQNKESEDSPSQKKLLLRNANSQKDDYKSFQAIKNKLDLKYQDLMANFNNVNQNQIDQPSQTIRFDNGADLASYGDINDEDDSLLNVKEEHQTQNFNDDQNNPSFVNIGTFGKSIQRQKIKCPVPSAKTKGNQQIQIAAANVPQALDKTSPDENGQQKMKQISSIFLNKIPSQNQNSAAQQKQQKQSTNNYNQIPNPHVTKMSNDQYHTNDEQLEFYIVDGFIITPNTHMRLGIKPQKA